ncbi:MAG: hypothetical protein ACOCWQ_00715 [Nanoarchaeota archaeon]
MVVNPQELLSTVTQPEQETLARLEERIDRHLTRSFEGGMVAVAYDADCKALRRPVFEGFLGRYRQQGWTDVRVVHDPRDGSYIQFKYEGIKRR